MSKKDEKEFIISLQNIYKLIYEQDFKGIMKTQQEARALKRIIEKIEEKIKSYKK